MSFSELFLCSVVGCKNGSLKTIGTTPLFRVPSGHLAEEWAEALDDYIRITDLSQAFICKEHFKPEDLHDDNKLRESAIPSIFPERYREPVMPKKLEKEKKMVEESHSECLTTKFLASLKQSRAALERELNQLQQQEAHLDHTIYTLKSKLKSPKIPQVSREDVELLRKCFSPAQIELFTDVTQTPKWDNNDYALAYVIYSMTSSEVYRHLRDNIHYPLPKLSGVFRFLREHRARNYGKKAQEEEEEEDEERGVEATQVLTREEDMETCDEEEEEMEDEGVETIRILGEEGEAGLIQILQQD